MKVQEEIESMKKIHGHILNLLDQEDDQEEVFQNIINEIEDQKLSKGSHLFKTFLRMISKILNNYTVQKSNYDCTFDANEHFLTEIYFRESN